MIKHGIGVASGLGLAASAPVAWTQVPAPTIGVFSVAVISSTTAWSVAGLIAHWNGTA